MTFRIGMCLIVLAALLSAPCAALRVVEPAPQPAAQAEIERLVATIVAANEGGPDEEIPAVAEQLQRLMDDDRESLLLQLVLYLADHRGNERTMGAALLIDFYQFTSQEKIAALAPYLDTNDGRLRDVMWEVLSTVDRPSGGKPDFRSYEAVLNKGENGLAGLIRYMYAVSPIDALAATARAYARGDATDDVVERAREFERLRALHGPEGVVDADRARREIDALSRDAAWWVRLYAANVLRTHPDLGSPEIAARLRSDAHELVSEAAARPPRTTVRTREPGP